LVYNASRERDAQRDFDATVADARRSASGGCGDLDCEQAVRGSAEALASVQAREPWGWAGLGFGTAALGAGVWMLLTADDPDKYHADSEQLASSLALELTATGATVRGSF
jgi:hypothetical protein